MKQSSAASDSLDLLLDTICNTFGSIVFLSLLVVLMVRQQQRDTTDRPPPPSEEEQLQLADLQIENARLQETVERLRGQVKQLDEEKALPEARRALGKLKVLQAELDRLLAIQKQVHDQIISDQQQRNELAGRVRELALASEKLEEELEKLRGQLKNVERQRGQAMRIPRARKTEKIEISFLLTKGSLHFVHELSPSGIKGLSDQCRYEERDGVTQILPRPGKGIRITQATVQELKRRLAHVDPKTYYLAAFVWEDSFSEWVQVRKVLHELGLEYALAPMTKDSAVFFGAKDPKFVQ